MEELFGAPMDILMWVFLGIFLVPMAVVVFLAWRNRIMLKLGLRNIPRRKTQTVLIIVGIMLSSVIMAAAFGVGDTISFSIRKEAVQSLGPIDEIVIPVRAGADDDFSASPYVPFERFERLERELAGVESIDGLAAGIGETVPAVNLRTSLSEGRMRVAGVDPDSLQGLGSIALVEGGEVRLEDLAANEAYINDEAAEELEAVAGDELRLIVEGSPLTFTVRGVVARGGLAGDSSTLIITLERAQAIFDRPGQINSIVVSNRGDEVSGADLSDEVAERLRLLFADRAVAGELHVLLNQGPVLDALEVRQEALTGDLQADLSRMREELQRGELSDRLVSLMADRDVSDEVLAALGAEGLTDVQREADTLFLELGEFFVLEIKQIILDAADEISSFVTTFFIVLGLFSIMVGVLLIFLIFVMLAAARRSEMGMARAVGAKRSHLVQMFLFEGTAYAVVSAAVGVLLGLAVSALIIVLVNRAIAGVDEDFRFTRHFEARSAIVAYCLGMIITFATVAFSSYRVSRLNIVSAVRDLPTPIVVSSRGWREVLAAPVRALLVPPRLGWRSVVALVTIHPLRALALLRGALWAVVAFLAVGIGAILQLLWRPFTQGWLAFLLGLLLAQTGIANELAAPFTIGVSLMIIGIGLTVRMVLRRSALRAETRDRIAYTFIGVVMLVFWALPFDTFESITGELEGDIEMFFVSGISMVAAAVWTVMYNADLLLRAASFAGGRFGRLRPVLVTAVAYPMSAKFRTGLTLAMFGLVIFTLIVMSILTNVFDVSTVDQDAVTGRWDIEGNLNISTPIDDIRQAIVDEPDLRIEDFEAVGGYTTFGIQARQVGAEAQQWEGYAVRVADDEFLEATGYKLKLIADGYGPAERDVWLALKSDPSLAVVEAWVVPTDSGFDDDGPDFQLEGLTYEDDSMSPISIEVREPRSGVVVPLTVIGVMDRLTDGFGDLGFGMFTSKSKLDEAIPFPVPISTYRFRVAEGVDMAQAARDLEAAFQENGMETEVLEEVIADNAAANRAFNFIFTGFMGLGLLVGIAALGVISTRAVVERRQQIGVLRALGYRRGMVQLSFLLESSFVALLGTAIGVALGVIISFNIVNDVQEDIETIRFRIPWLQIGVIIAIAYFFSLLTTFLPARQASRIQPAEALRYE